MATPLAAAAPVPNPGDITPTTPRADTGLQLQEIHIRLSATNQVVELRFTDGLGGAHLVSLRNGLSDGFNYATNAAVFGVSTPTGFTDALTALGIAVTAAQKTALVTLAKNNGLIVVTGTVG